MMSENAKVSLKVSLVILCLSACAAKKMPDYMPRCYRDDPDLADCILKATETVRPFMVSGIPEIGIRPISPLNVPSINLAQGTPAVNINAKLENVTLTGLDTYKFRKFSFDTKTLRAHYDFYIRELYLVGQYSITGQILSLPIVGSGRAIMNTTNGINTTALQRCSLVKKNGKDYLKAGKLDVDFHLADFKMDLQGLFNGDENLGKAVMDVFNDNALELITEYKPVIVGVIRKIVRDVLSNVVESIPYDELLPFRNPQN